MKQGAYHGIVIDKLKIFVFESNKLKNKSLTHIFLSEETKNNLMKFIGIYKKSNAINEKISEKGIINIYNAFGTYAFDQQDIFIVYGLNSNIFGIVFGGLLIPKDTLSFDVYSIFQLILAYADNVNNNYIKRDDLLLNKQINNMIGNRKL